MKPIPPRDRLRASALFYAVTVALLVSSVTGSMILLTHYRSLRAERFLAIERAQSNALSAIQMVIGGKEDDVDVDVTIDLWGDGTDSVRIAELTWGLLQRITATATVGGRQATIEAFAGQRFRNDVVLDLTKGGGALHVCGDTRIIGNVVVPQADVRRGHIEGQSFSGDKLVEGSVALATERDVTIRELIRSRARSVDGSTTVLDDPAKVIEFTGPSWVTGLDYPSGVFVYCTDTLFIAADTHLDMALIQAPFIVIEPGTQGRMQCFATRGIEVGQNVRLHFPSVLCTVRGVFVDGVATINIGENSSIQGSVLAIDDASRGHSAPCIRIAPGAIVEGEVHAQGAVEHRGIIHGRLTAEALTLRTTASAYSGYLLDAVIDTSRAGPFAIGCSPDDDKPHLLAWREIR